MVENCGRIRTCGYPGSRDREDPHETSTSSLRGPVHALDWTHDLMFSKDLRQFLEVRREKIRRTSACLRSVEVGRPT